MGRVGRLIGRLLYALGAGADYVTCGPVDTGAGPVAHKSRDVWAEVRRGGTLGQRQCPLARESRDVWATGPLGQSGAAVAGPDSVTRPDRRVGQSRAPSPGRARGEVSCRRTYCLSHPGRWNTYEVVWPGSWGYSRTGLDAQRDTVFPALDRSEGSRRIPSIKLGLRWATPAPISACATSPVGPGPGNEYCGSVPGVTQANRPHPCPSQRAF
jgi:hypothetical protein